VDRPISVANLLNPDPNLGLYAFEGSHAETIQDQFSNQITQLAALIPGVPYVISSWTLTGGGAGAGWRASFDVGLNPGWGFNTCIPLRLARLVCREVQHAGQLRAVVADMLGALPPTAFVFGIKHAASGRDGTYLVGILYCLQGAGSGNPSYYTDNYATQGPFVAETTVLSLTLPQTPLGDAVLGRDWAVHYCMLLNDTTGASGVLGRLKRNTVTLVESRLTLPATDWVSFSGVHYQTQDNTGATLLELTVDVVGANVSVRGACLMALLMNAPGADA